MRCFWGAILALVIFGGAAKAEGPQGEQGFYWDEPGQIVKAAGLKVLWWNVEYGHTNKSLPHRPLDKNIQALLKASDPQPDLIFFGEFLPSGVAKETLELLTKTYPYNEFHPYSSTCPQGFGVFSKIPLTLQSQKTLVWYRAHTKEFSARWENNGEELACYERPYLRYRAILPQGQVIQFVPTHLAQPWGQLTQTVHGPRGEFEVAREILSGTDNPHINQLSFLLEQLNGELDLERAPVVMLGDFNVPLTLEGFETKASSLLRSYGLFDGFVPENIRATFPSPTSFLWRKHRLTKIDHLKIDQVVSSRNVTISNAQVLPLSGSDHYPIYFSLPQGAPPASVTARSRVSSPYVMQVYR
jgi:endonuclease/exonuclease/phosphatase (EEP) superfamily protein YafD